MPDNYKIWIAHFPGTPRVLSTLALDNGQGIMRPLLEQQGIDVAISDWLGFGESNIFNLTTLISPGSIEKKLSDTFKSILSESRKT